MPRAAILGPAFLGAAFLLLKPVSDHVGLSLPIYVSIGAVLCLFAAAWYFYGRLRNGGGGDGGRARVFGSGSFAKGGDGGWGAGGGRGGDAVVKGRGSVALGGRGGDASKRS